MAKVTIIYKSGAKVVAECDEFVIRKSVTGELLECEWRTMDPSPLFLGVDEIAAVYEGKA